MKQVISSGIAIIFVLILLFLTLRRKRERASELKNAGPGLQVSRSGPGVDGRAVSQEAGTQAGKDGGPGDVMSRGCFGEAERTSLVELRGELKTIRVPDLLQLLAACKNTGTLSIRSRHDEKSLYFRNGKICSASCLDQDNKNKLGSLLIKLGKITDIERAIALAVCGADPSKRLGKALIEIGAVQKEDLREALRVQAEEIVYSMFVFPEGRFEFIKEEPNIDPDEYLSLDVMNLLMEGARREDEWQNMRQALPSMEIILDFTEEGRESLDWNALTRDQSLTLALVNGERSVHEICLRSTMVDFDVCEFLCRLIRLSVLKQADPTELSQERPKVADRQGR